MRLAVIGGSGFIGSHVVDKLIEAGHDVTVYDIMRPHREDVRHIFLDLFDFHKVVVGLAGNYEAVYLLAAMANVNDIFIALIGPGSKKNGTTRRSRGR